MNIMNRLRSVISTPEIEFLCDKDDFGVIPEPFPARKLMPEWYKHLTPKIDNQNKLENSTIKRCAPFLDAMTLGWIIPLAADVEFITNDDVSGVNYKWSFYKTMVENHSKAQISTDTHKHPSSPKPPMKFLNWWAIKVPKDYSVLFVPPLNRRDPRFECIAGMVDDGYMGTEALEYINFPFIFNEPNYTGIIRAGTPLVQVIPIKRETMIKKSKSRILNDKDIEQMQKTRRMRKSHESFYRDKLWVRNKGN
jgi:hypothetical protein